MHYLTGSDDRALALPFLPQPAGGSPFIVSTDIEIRFAYSVNPDSLPPHSARLLRDPADTLVEVVADESLLTTGKPATDVYIVCDTGLCTGYICRHYHGTTPIGRHPLADKAMFDYGAFEVKPSAWLQHVRRAEPDQFPKEILASFNPSTGESAIRQLTYHHLLFVFSDSTLEFITDRLFYEIFSGAESVRQEMQRVKWKEDYM